MVRGSRMSRSTYEAASLLIDFRDQVGFSRFGLVAQALLAHVLLRLGGKVLEINNPGHPDILALLGGQLYSIEAETVKYKTVPRKLTSADLDVLLTSRDGERGFFCVLDCGPPVAWLCVDVATLGARVDGKLHLSLLRGYSDRELSLDCTVEFSKLVIQEAKELRRVTYGQLRDEALHGMHR